MADSLIIPFANADALLAAITHADSVTSAFKTEGAERYAMLEATGIIAALERNLSCGLAMRQRRIRPTHLSDDVFGEMELLQARLAERRLAAVNAEALRCKVNALYASDVMLAGLYGFGYAGGVDIDLREMARNCNDARIAAYVSGAAYYIEARGVIESGRGKLPSPKRRGLKADNPWVLLARCEYASEARHAGAVRVFDGYAGMCAIKRVTTEKRYLLDSHTYKRVDFRLAYERFLANDEWSERILAGFTTGVKRDADLAASAIISFCKQNPLAAEVREYCKTAALYGYRAAAYMCMFLSGFGKSDSKADLFELFICAQDDDEYRFRYYKTHDYIKGNERELLGGNIGDTTRLELFNHIKDDPSHLEESYKLASELGQKYKDAALWLGFYEFNNGDYEKAFRAFDRAYIIDDRNTRAANMLAHCYLHGYGAAEDYKLAFEYRRACDDPASNLAWYLHVAYGIGCAPNPAGAQAQLVSEPESHERNFLQALLQVAQLNYGAKSFWNKVWKAQDYTYRYAATNINERHVCFRPFVELICADYVIKYHRKHLRFEDWVLYPFSPEGNPLAATLRAYFSWVNNAADMDAPPRRLERLAAVFSKDARAMLYKKIAKSIEWRLGSVLSSLDLLYRSDTKMFDSMLWVPWAEELRVTLEGRRLRYEAAKADSWLAIGLLEKSAKLGDGLAALTAYSAHEFAVKGKDALALLDTAIECGIPEAFSENAYLIEHGALERGDLFETYALAIIRGNRLAAVNAETTFAHIVPDSRSLSRIKTLIRKFIAVP